MFNVRHDINIGSVVHLAGGDMIESGRRRARIWSGGTVPMWDSDGMYLLAIDPAGISGVRVDAGTAPLLLDHRQWSASAVIGRLLPGTLAAEDGAAFVEFDFSPSALAQEIRADVEAGHRRAVSMGFDILSMEVTEAAGGQPRTKTVTSCELWEVSLVPVPADGRAVVLSCRGRDIGDEREKGVSKMNHPIAGTPAASAPPAVVDLAAERASATTAERERVTVITRLSQQFSAACPAEIVTAAINGGTTVEEFRSAMVERLAAAQAPIDGRHGGGVGARVGVLADERDKRLSGLEAALLGRARLAADDPANDYRGFSLYEMARVALQATGAAVRGMGSADVVDHAMGLKGMRLSGQHSSSDFPLLLANVANKSMLAGYEYATPTYRAWAKAATAKDFRTISRVRMSETPGLTLVVEGGEITRGQMSDKREQYALATYGRSVAITRQAIVNDDLGAFADIVPGMGRQAARLENSTVYGILTANAAMSDSVALFHASHGNLTTGVISIASLDAARALMMVQKGIDGSTVLNLTPRFLIVPAAKFTIAQQYTQAAGILPATQANFNPFSGTLQPIADAILDATSTVEWYLACDPMDVATVEYATLEGSPGPRIQSREDFEREGIEIKVVHDFAAKAVDHRGLVKSSGV